MNIERFNDVIEYALLLAGQQGAQLGEIHLLKYAYLFDLKYAQAHSGSTFTGIRWKFLHFGPYAQAAQTAIPVLMNAIRADERRIADNQHEHEYVRWYAKDERRLQELERRLDVASAADLKRNVRSFGGDKEPLLRLVYATDPMRRAAPGEELQFGAPVQSEDDSMSVIPRISPKRLKLLKERLRELRERRSTRPAERAIRLEVSPSLLDDVYANGMDWLDSAAALGEDEFPPEGTLEFDDNLWKSKFRSDDLPQ